MPTTHVRLNLAQLVRRLHALPGVQHYLFCRDCRRASLWRWPHPVAWPDGVVVLAPSSARSPDLLLALPLAWARGLLQVSDVPPLSALAAAGGEWVGLACLPATAAACPSQLGTLWQRYRQHDASPAAPADIIERLHLERLLGRRFAPGSLETTPRRQPLPLAGWLADPPAECGSLADDLMAILHLLPVAEQEPFAQALAGRIAEGLAAEAGDPAPWLRLLEALVGGINSRAPQRQALAERLRALGLERGAALPDPAARGLVLMRLLQVSPASSPALLARLASAIDALVLAIGRASTRGDRDARRQRARALETVLRSAGPNLLLLRALVPLLGPDTCYRLPFVQPPSACLPLLKGLLLLDTATLEALPEVRRKALVSMVERILPRLWWQRPLLLRLLHDLRRFPLELGWLWRRGALLEGMELLHSRGIAPPCEPPEVAPQPGAEPPDPQLLLRTQALVLLRLQPARNERAGLLRLAGAAGPSPLLRLLDGHDEEALVMATAGGLAARSVVLTRLAAERRGVPELLPPLLPRSDVETAYRTIVATWRRRFGDQAGLARAPIAVAITTHDPPLPLLALALEALALQTLQPQEVWLVDDGSPPERARALADLVQACRQRLQLPLRLLRREDNGGQYACRNLVLEAMGCEVLAIQDDDDLSHPLRLALQWQTLEQGVAAVYTSHVRLDQATAALQADGDGCRFFGDGITTLMLNRSTALALGGFYPVRSRGDVEFRGRLERRYGDGNVVRLPQPLYLMRGGLDTVSSRFEYGCSLALPGWRRLMHREVLV